MIKKTTLLHLRIPFSLYLLPFFCFAISQSPTPNIENIILSFFVIHLFFYPASNGYNSYYDKDEESIGGLEKPPPVDVELLYVSLIMDGVALLISVLISIDFMLMLLGIGIVSKCYSHPAVRLKKYPMVGLLTVALFQGAWTYLMSYIAINNLSVENIFQERILFAAALCSLLLLGSYPMTQVYQHNEDTKRGDVTMSRMLGIKGTFRWTMLIFTIGVGGFMLYFKIYYSVWIIIAFLLFLSPVLIYFLMWYIRVLKDEKAADFKSTMRLNLYSSICFVAFFIVLFFLAR